MNPASQELINALVQAFGNMSKADWRKTTRWGVKSSEIRLLLTIRERYDQQPDKAVTVSELSKTLQVTSPTVTQIVNGLIKGGYIRRSAHPEDRRISEITLTEQGDRLARQAAADIQTIIGGLVEHLGAERSALLASLLNEAHAYLKASRPPS